MPADRKFTPKADPFERIEFFEIQDGKHSGHVLRAGDWFRFFNLEGAYKFKQHVITPLGNEWVSAYGGNAKDPNGENSWRSFPVGAKFIPAKSQRKEDK